MTYSSATTPLNAGLMGVIPLRDICSLHPHAELLAVVGEQRRDCVFSVPTTVMFLHTSCSSVLASDLVGIRLNVQIAVQEERIEVQFAESAVVSCNPAVGAPPQIEKIRGGTIANLGDDGDVIDYEQTVALDLFRDLVEVATVRAQDSEPFGHPRREVVEPDVGGWRFENRFELLQRELITDHLPNLLVVRLELGRADIVKEYLIEEAIRDGTYA